MDDDQNQPVDEATLEPQEVPEEDTPEEESVEDLRARLAKAEEIAENQRIRAEKAESAKKVEKPAKNVDLSAADIVAITKANIEPEDIEDVLEYARFKKIPLHEAIKSSVVKATLAEKAEHRKSAAALSTGPARRGTTAVPEEALLSNARTTGALPESDADINRLVQARLKSRRG